MADESRPRPDRAEIYRGMMPTTRFPAGRQRLIAVDRRGLPGGDSPCVPGKPWLSEVKPLILFDAATGEELGRFTAIEYDGPTLLVPVADTLIECYGETHYNSLAVATTARLDCRD